VSALKWVLLIVTLISQQCIPTENNSPMIYLFQKALLNDIVTGRKAYLEKADQDGAMLNIK